MNTYEFKIGDLDETSCAVDIISFLQGKKEFPRSDGSSYILRQKDIRKIYAAIWKNGVYAYEVMRDRHQEEVNAFPFFFAFSNKQFEEGMRKFGLDPKDTSAIYSLESTGGFYRRTDAARLREMFARHEKERQEALDSDPSGDGFIHGMFYVELSDREYTYTYDTEDTLEALNISLDDVNSNPKLRRGLNTAMDALRREANLA